MGYCIKQSLTRRTQNTQQITHHGIHHTSRHITRTHKQNIIHVNTCTYIAWYTRRMSHCTTCSSARRHKMQHPPQHNTAPQTQQQTLQHTNWHASHHTAEHGNVHNMIGGRNEESLLSRPFIIVLSYLQKTINPGRRLQVRRPTSSRVGQVKNQGCNTQHM